MDLELESYVEEVMEKQQFRSGIFRKSWGFPDLFDIFRRRTP
jgi:hypothetical protein